jgi:hypothetical protein
MVSSISDGLNASKVSSSAAGITPISLAAAAFMDLAQEDCRGGLELIIRQLGHIGHEFFQHFLCIKEIKISFIMSVRRVVLYAMRRLRWWTMSATNLKP